MFIVSGFACMECTWIHAAAMQCIKCNAVRMFTNLITFIACTTQACKPTELEQAAGRAGRDLRLLLLGPLLSCCGDSGGLAPATAACRLAAL